MNSGLLIINKPIGITSRAVVDHVVKLVNSNKVGHTGSLDPFATGVLIITVNKATKIGPFIENLNKTYTATLKLGFKTDTGDNTGQVIETSSVIDLNSEYVQQVLDTFLGSQKQTPPMYSSLKIDGVPLHKYARQGINIDRSPRPFHVYDIRLLSTSADTITFSTVVSKGTYIRTLGEDIAEKMGMVGHLEKLHRNGIGDFKDDKAMEIDKINLKNTISIVDGLAFLEKIVIPINGVKAIKDGKPQLFKNSPDTVLLVEENNEPIAIYKRRDDGVYHCQRGLF